MNIDIKFDPANPLHKERKLLVQSLATMTPADMILLLKALAQKAGIVLKN